MVLLCRITVKHTPTHTPHTPPHTHTEFALTPKILQNQKQIKNKQNLKTKPNKQTTKQNKQQNKTKQSKTKLKAPPFFFILIGLDFAKDFATLND